MEYTVEFDRYRTCWVNVPFKKENKGLEGIVYLTRYDDDYVLGLCEGNWCRGGDAGRKPGGGRIHVLRKRDGAWESIAEIKLPESLPFEDYASMALLDDRLAVLSQELAQAVDRELAPDRWEIVDEGTVVGLPNGKKDYSNLEGISWLDDRTFVAVSDRRKKNDQPKRCAKRDQSVHIFEGCS